MTNKYGYGWTDERVELLTKLWRAGLSASQIARQLGGVTRNACVGKVHRLGLSGTGGFNRPPPSAPAVAKPIKAPPVARAPNQNGGLAFSTRKRPDVAPGNPVENKVASVRANLACEPLPTPKGELTATCTMEGLGGYMCKWPIGDPQIAGFGFCGRRAGDGPYCADHVKRAYASRSARDWVDKRLAMPTREQRAA